MRKYSIPSVEILNMQGEGLMWVELQSGESMPQPSPARVPYNPDYLLVK